MKTLMRASASGFSINEARTLRELETLSAEELEKAIYPTEYIFKDLPRVTLSPFFTRLARCGVEIYLKKIGFSGEIGERVTLFDEKGFFALGEIREFNDGLAIKPIRQFDV